MYSFLHLRIVTYIFIIDFVCVLLDFTKENLYIGDFKSVLQTHLVLGF
jgi:hypothetical protein